MPITANDVIYNLVEGSKRAGQSDPRVQAVFDITFGDGTADYPSGGVPLLKGKLGCPTNLDELIIMDASAGDGYVYKYDSEDETIRIYQVAAVNDTDPAAPLVELTGSDEPAETTIRVRVTGW